MLGLTYLLCILVGCHAVPVPVATADELASAIKAQEPEIQLVDSITGLAPQSSGVTKERYTAFPQVCHLALIYTLQTHGFQFRRALVHALSALCCSELCDMPSRMCMLRFHPPSWHCIHHVAHIHNADVLSQTDETDFQPSASPGSRALAGRWDLCRHLARIRICYSDSGLLFHELNLLLRSYMW